MQDTLKQRYEDLLQAIRHYSRVIVAYSGGVDSSLVLKACLDALGKENVLAVIATSQLDERDISREASQQAEALGSKWRIISINELAHEGICQYSADSWYHSKMLLYQTLERIQHEESYDVIMDGMIMNDQSDFRPGLLARDHAGVVSLLQEQNIYKEDVRQLLKMLQQDIWSKPASCSLLSRFSYGDTIDETKLQRIRRGEAYLRERGFETNRVRVHGDLARIEVSSTYVEDIIVSRQAIYEYFKEIGFTFVSVDLQGYQSGKMNNTLTEAQKDKYQRGKKG